MTGFPRSLPVLATLGAALLAGCTDAPPVSTVAQLRPVEMSQHIPYSFAGRCSSALSAAQVRHIRDYLRANTGTDSVIVVSVPRACTQLASDRRIVVLNRAIGRAGDEIRFEIAHADDPVGSQGIVRIAHVTGVTVDQTACTGDGSCVQARNLAAMIADPRDTFLPDTGNRYWKPPATTSHTPTATTAASSSGTSSLTSSSGLGN